MHTLSWEQSCVWIGSQLLPCSSSKMLCRWTKDEAQATDADRQGGVFQWRSDESQKDLLFSHGAVLNSSKFGGEGLTSACLIGHLAKYNLKPPPHGHAQAFDCTPSVNTWAHTLFLRSAHTHRLIYSLVLQPLARSFLSTRLILHWDACSLTFDTLGHFASCLCLTPKQITLCGVVLMMLRGTALRLDSHGRVYKMQFSETADTTVVSFL